MKFFYSNSMEMLWRLEGNPKSLRPSQGQEVNASRLPSNNFIKTENLHWNARFAAGINVHSSLVENLALPVQKLDSLSGGSAPLEVPSIGSLDPHRMFWEIH